MSFTLQTPQEHALERYDELLQHLEAVERTAEESHAGGETQARLRLSVRERGRGLRNPESGLGRHSYTAHPPVGTGPYTAGLGCRCRGGTVVPSASTAPSTERSYASLDG